MNPLEIAFPGLVVTGYCVTSPATLDYNCLGWAGKTDSMTNSMRSEANE